MKIFVSIAAYRDLELQKTVRDAINKAAFPEDLNFAILTQDIPNKHPDLSFVPNLKHLQMNYKEAKGAGYARKVLMEEYEGEDFFFQTDSHMRFAPNWDVRMITMLKESQELAGTEKVILSQFPAPYKPLTNGQDNFEEGNPHYWSDPSWTSVVRTFNDVWAGNREAMHDKGRPHPSHTILAGYVFAPGNLPQEVPYDPRISFMGEELCFAIRAYTRGWKIYAPNEMLLWHYYNRKGNPKVWTQRDDMGRETKWNERERISHETQERVLTAQETGVFGIGDHSLYQEYQDMVGINFAEFYRKRDKSR